MQITRVVLAFALLWLCGSILSQEPLNLVVKNTERFQVIQNIGASGCWYTEPIGKHWPDEKKEKLAELLFSLDTLPDGSPKGLGLSAWRFNIGAGTAEQGDDSGISDPHRRVECFMGMDGRYDWNKQSGYQWFLRKAKEYQVRDLIAFVNSPPVYYTKNGLGFLLEKGTTTNLKDGYYQDFSSFLCTVVEHFDKEGIHFTYLSPINEPQWDWSFRLGKAKQEGTPYQNEEIHRVINILDKEITERNLSTKILFPEAAKLNHLINGNAIASDQIEQFWNPVSPLYLGNCTNATKVAAGHSYFTDVGDNPAIRLRQNLARKTDKYNLEYWQSEYCLLGDGYREGSYRRSTFDCGMFLAKMIHYDLTEGNASAWHFWNAFEPGGWKHDTRYYLIALKPHPDWKDGEFYLTGNYYALGHFSRFIRPSMQRISAEFDGQEGDLFVSAYADNETGKLVIVVINYSNIEYEANIQSGKNAYKVYKSNQHAQLKSTGYQNAGHVIFSGRSMYTLVSD